jgi:hypothetical protein
MSGMGSHFSGESRRLSFNRSACAAIIGAGAVLAILMASSAPAFSQAPPPATQTAADENAQDDHSYLPPSMHSQTESASPAVAIETQAHVHMPAKTISSRRAAHRRARREHWDYGWPGGRGWGPFGN